MKKSILFGMLIVFFGGLLGSTAFAGAPPSVEGPAAGPGRPTTLGKRGAVSFELGYYNPSLKTLNDDLKVYGFPEIGSNLLLSVKAVFGPGPFGYMGLSYWSSSSTRVADKTEAKVTLLSMPFGVEVPILTGTLPEQVMLYIGVDGKLVLPLWRYGTTSEYYNAYGIGYDIAAKFGGQFFVVPDTFSIGGSIGYVFLGKTGQLTVTSSTLPGWEVDDKLETSDGEKLVLELSGITLMFDIRLYF